MAAVRLAKAGALWLLAGQHPRVLAAGDDTGASSPPTVQSASGPMRAHRAVPARVAGTAEGKDSGTATTPSLRGATADEGCADLLTWCSSWASAGHCSSEWVYQDLPVGSYWCPASCDQCTTAATTTTANGGGGGGAGSLDGDMQAVLDRHNYWRSQHSAPALQWDDSLAAAAAIWASGCLWQHSDTPYGENLYAASGISFDGAGATDSWYNEIRDYNWNSPGFSGATGHFTQLVWVGSTKLGCAVQKCASLAGAFSNAWYLVCEYSPAGNVLGQFEANVLRS